MNSGSAYLVIEIGLPHSEIPGSKFVCNSPRLIAACHVLHRLLAPRHPPYALSSLTIKLTQRLSGSHRLLYGSIFPAPSRPALSLPKGRGSDGPLAAQMKSSSDPTEISDAKSQTLLSATLVFALEFRCQRTLRMNFATRSLALYQP